MELYLASGQSTRMGQSKLLLSWKGMPLIEHLLITASSIPFLPMSMVIPDQNVTLKKIIAPYDCQPLYNSSSHLGMGHSLSLAIRSLPRFAKAAVIMLGDQPTLHMNDILHVLQEFTQMQSRENRCPKTIIQTKYQNGRVGHPILFSNHFFNDLKSLKGDVGGKEISVKIANFYFSVGVPMNIPKILIHLMTINGLNRKNIYLEDKKDERNELIIAAIDQALKVEEVSLATVVSVGAQHTVEKGLKC